MVTAEPLANPAPPGWGRAHVREQVVFKDRGVLVTGKRAWWTPRVPGSDLPYAGPLFASEFSETPMTFPALTGADGIIEAWAPEPVRLVLSVWADFYPSTQMVVDLLFTEDATTAEEGPAGPPGPQGDPGPAGTPGAQGDPGQMGPRGQTGQQGPSGQDGEDGTDGVPGPPGLTGPPGATGPPGIAGAQGAAGPQGIPGAPGATGAVGPAGPQGDTGPAGAPSTVPGPQGPQGVKGDTGATGAQGAQGPQGIQGVPGTTPDMSAYYTKTEANTLFATQTALTAATARISTLEGQVATLMTQMTGHWHDAGDWDALGGTTFYPPAPPP